LQGQQGILNLQNQMGSQMQTQEQNKVNQAIQNYAMQQQYPMQQLSAMSGLLRGLPLQSATTQSYQAAPSAISQLSGLGLTGAAAYGMMKKEGGVIKSYAEGGSVDPDGAEFDEPQGFVSGGISQAISRKVLMNPDAYSKQTIDKSTKNGIVDDIVGLAAIQQKNKDEKERLAAASMGQPKPPTVKDQILAERAALDQQGIEAAQSNLPTEYAGGGIIAFDEGGDVPRFDGEEGSVVTDNGPTGSWGKAIGEWWKNNTIGSPEYLEKKGTMTSEEAKASREKLNAIDKQVETSNAAYLNGDLDKPAQQDNLTVVRDNKGKPGPAAPAAPAAPSLDALYAKDAGGIDSIIKQLTGDLRSSEESDKDAKKQAKLMAMMQAGLGIMGGTSPFAAVNAKGAIPALQCSLQGTQSNSNTRT